MRTNGIEVYSDKKLVGTIHGVESRKGMQKALIGRTIERSYFPPGDGFGEPTGNKGVELLVVSRCHMITNIEIENFRGSGVSLRQKVGIPEYAHVKESLEQQAWIYEWKVFKVSSADLEDLFDLNEFTPVESGPSDMEALHNTRWMI